MQIPLIKVGWNASKGQLALLTNDELPWVLKVDICEVVEPYNVDHWSKKTGEVVETALVSWLRHQVQIGNLYYHLLRKTWIYEAKA